MSRHKPAHEKTETERRAYNERKTREKRARNTLAGTTDLPEGHRLKGVSVLTGADGALDSRWDKTERDTTARATTPLPAEFTIKKVARCTDSQGQTRAEWRSYDQAAADRFSAMVRACESFATRYQSKYIPRPGPVAGFGARLLNVFPLGDPHIGMLAWAPASGENFDLKIASASLRAVVDELVTQAPCAGEALLVNVGDFFHADDNTQLTPGHGNKLDVEGRSEKVFDLGCELMVWLITRLLEKHEIVRVFNAPGNHDPQTSRFLAAWLRAWFRAEPRVVIEPNLNPFAYYRFGRTLFGVTHGDNCKPAELPEIMAADARELWGQTEWHLWLTGHVHHDQVKDYRDCSVMTFCTLAARDYWHNWKGYRARRALQRMTFDLEKGLLSTGRVDLVNITDGAA